jgi:hypothetical protein
MLGRKPKIAVLVAVKKDGAVCKYYWISFKVNDESKFKDSEAPVEGSTTPSRRKRVHASICRYVCTVGDPEGQDTTTLEWRAMNTGSWNSAAIDHGEECQTAYVKKVLNTALPVKMADLYKCMLLWCFAGYNDYPAALNLFPVEIEKSLLAPVATGAPRFF